jgi:hypothetical protein
MEIIGERSIRIKLLSLNLLFVPAAFMLICHTAALLPLLQTAAAGGGNRDHSPAGKYSRP